MLKLDGHELALEHFTDGTLKIREYVARDYSQERSATITWHYENDLEIMALIYITRHLQEHGVQRIHLNMPFIPNARQDRVETDKDIFTLKYFAELINTLHFASVTVFDPHSKISEAIIDRIVVRMPKPAIDKVIERIGADDLLLFCPDEGAMKRYASMVDAPCIYGIKQRDWATGKIVGFNVVGDVDQIPGKRILIIDDICSKGDTIFHSAEKLKALGASDIYVFVSHCENTVLDRELLSSGLIRRLFTTDSILTKPHSDIEIVYHV